MRPLLAVVVLNWNGANDTIACLESLRRSSMKIQTIVVDNGSTDNSVERIAETYLADELVTLSTNLGYAEGNNVGLRTAMDKDAAVIAVLNNDTVVEPDTFELLVEHLSDREHRALSPDIRYFDRPSESWFAGGVIDEGWPRHLQPRELVRSSKSLRPSEWLSGCCIVARRETWESVGLFDPTYFLIFEDGEWSLRAAGCGVAFYVVPQSTILHRVSSSFATGPASLLGGYYFVRNGLRFELRYFPHYALRFAFRWLIRPTPELIRTGRGAELAFRCFGALAFAAGQRSRAPDIVERLAGLVAERRLRTPAAADRCDMSPLLTGLAIRYKHAVRNHRGKRTLLRYIRRRAAQRRKPFV